VASVRRDTAPLVPFVWHDLDALTGLLGPHGLTVEVHEHTLAFTAASPEGYAAEELANHPGWVEAREVLEPAGRWASVHVDLTALFAAANEDPAAFRVTSRYVVATAAKT
jgi:hypothetical protein